MLNLLTLVGFIVTGWRVMLTDTINHGTDKHNRTGQTSLQTRLWHGRGEGRGLKKTENRPWYELYLDRCQPCSLSSVSRENVSGEIWVWGVDSRDARDASQLHILLCLVSPVSLTASQDLECWPPELNFTAPPHETIPQSISSQTLQLNLNCW